MRRSQGGDTHLPASKVTPQSRRRQVFFPHPLLGLQNGICFGRNPGGLGPSFSSSKGSSTELSYGWRWELTEVMTRTGQAHSDTQRPVESVRTLPALFLDDSCSPRNKINVFSCTSKSYFLLLESHNQPANGPGLFWRHGAILWPPPWTDRRLPSGLQKGRPP